MNDMNVTGTIAGLLPELPERGLVMGLDNADYHALHSLSSGGVKRMLRSPAHFLEARRNPPTSTPAMQFGTVLHTAVLEPGKLGDVVAVIPANAPSGRSKEAVAWHEAFAVANIGRIILSTEQWARIEVMAHNVLATDNAAEFLTDGAVEATVLWREQGIACRARPDFMPADPKIVVDLKTAKDASREQFARAVWSYRYDIQAAWYVDGITAATDFMPSHFLWCVVESDPPHAVAWYRAESDVIEIGRRDCMRGLANYRRCLERDSWPGYDPRIRPLSLPRWARSINAGDLDDNDY